RTGLRRWLIRLRGRPIRDHSGRRSGTRAVGMRACGSARRSNHPGQSSLFGTWLDRRCRTAAGAAVAQAGPTPGIPLSAAGPWAQTHGEAELIERRKIRPFGAYTLVRFRRAGAHVASRAVERV